MNTSARALHRRASLARGALTTLWSSAFALALALGACGGGDDAGAAPVEQEDAGQRVDAAPRSGSDAGKLTARDGAAPAASVPVDAGARDANSAGPVDVSRDRDGAADTSVSTSDAASDDIFGSKVSRSESWWVEGGRIHRGANEVRLFGLNWFGIETEAGALFGPNEAKRTVADFLVQIKALGFNALRVPLSPEAIAQGVASADWAKRGDIDTRREHFEELARAAKDAGMYMLWDIHTCAYAVGFMKKSPLDPACTGYGRERWLDDLKTLARLAKDYAPYVVGIDLFNEPYGLTWPDWKGLAEAGGRAVLSENPSILTFVEGVGSEGYSDPDGVFWGENLSFVQQQPVQLPSARLVYSPHVYGPSVYVQPYFEVAGFPGNMPAIWDKHFGALFAGAQPVVMGEFGGKYVDKDKVWQDAFVRYLRERGARSFFYWSLNPNSGDTGGLLLDDWKTVHAEKLALLKQLMQ